jgi:aminomethyltransferase
LWLLQTGDRHREAQHVTPRQTVLHRIQSAHGAKMIDFHGWEMPVQFNGIAAEHVTVRSSCGIFDLNHMGRLHCAGSRAFAFLARRVCRSLDNFKPGQVRYGLILAADGTVEDDVLVSCETEQSFHIVVNASNKDKVLDLWKGAAAAEGVELRDISDEQAMIAVQGPQAAAVLAKLGLDGSQLRYYRFADLSWRGVPVRLSRTGYTGEDGFECFCATEHAEALWTSVREAGAVPCGLGCRDTLRLEAGMPLYGNELDRSVTPAEAGLEFAINKNGGFIGAEVVLKQLADGAGKRLVGLTMIDKRVPRSGYPILSHGAQVGHITSGTLSPTLGKAIGMGYVKSYLSAPGTDVIVDIRGAQCAAKVVALPFYKRPVG